MKKKLSRDKTRRTLSALPGFRASKSALAVLQPAVDAHDALASVAVLSPGRIDTLSSRSLKEA